MITHLRPSMPRRSNMGSCAMWPSFKLISYFMPVSFIRMWLKLNGLWLGQGFCQNSRASNFKIDSWIWPNFWTVQDIMPVLFICKFHNDLIKTKHTVWHKDKYRLFWHSRASYSNINILIWPEFKLVPDFTPALIICKFNDDPMKTEHARLEIISFPL